MPKTNIIYCPHCRKCHYKENYTTSTAMGWSTVVKDGKVISEDPNIHTTYCTCLECGCEFSFDNKGNIYELKLGTFDGDVEDYDTGISNTLNEKIYTGNFSFDYSSLINNDDWKDYLCKWVISDKIENIKIQYKGMTYTVNVKKALDVLAEAIEKVEIINK